jgi:hypothetical protein
MFRFSIQYNDSYAFREYPRLTRSQRLHQAILPDMSGRDRPGVRRCETCRELVGKWGLPLAGLRLKRRKLDISITYDGVFVASQAFISVCDRLGIEGPMFLPLPDDNDFFAVKIERTVGFDFEKRGTRFSGPCRSCGQCAEVIGANPIYLREGAMIGDVEIVRTDIEFGSNDEKNYLLLCGAVARQMLSEEGLRGVDLYPLNA